MIKCQNNITILSRNGIVILYCLYITKKKIDFYQVNI